LGREVGEKKVKGTGRREKKSARSSRDKTRDRKILKEGVKRKAKLKFSRLFGGARHQGRKTTFIKERLGGEKR